MEPSWLTFTTLSAAFLIMCGIQLLNMRTIHRWKKSHDLQLKENVKLHLRNLHLQKELNLCRDEHR
jgi:hypothetical protein